jgi:hypothetical protein
LGRGFEKVPTAATAFPLKFFVLFVVFGLRDRLTGVMLLDRLVELPSNAGVRNFETFQIAQVKLSEFIKTY